jgi:bacteriocin-like protein
MTKKTFKTVSFKKLTAIVGGSTEYTYQLSSAEYGFVVQNSSGGGGFSPVLPRPGIDGNIITIK